MDFLADEGAGFLAGEGLELEEASEVVGLADEDF